jgi:hypothetical protein
MDINILKTYQDFNGSLGNLGRDSQSLEERGLFRTKSSVASRYKYITGCNGSCPGWCSDLVVKNDVTDFNKIFLSKHKAHISLDVGNNPLRKSIRDIRHLN